MTLEDMKALVGTRVEIPAHYDLWMRGARFGKIVSAHHGRGTPYLRVQMDHPQVKHPIKIWARDFDYMKELQ